MKIEHTHESAWWDEGKRYVIGLDEAGRGPIAGPLVVAGVCFPPHYAHEEIYDSKKLSEKTRERLYDEILAQAKVTRDRIMKQYDERYPQYGFARHKGYPTKAHLQALHEYGVLPIHRRSYGPVREALMPHLELSFDD